MSRHFRVARNPDPASRLPYLIWLPIDGGLVLKARDTWPRSARVFCAQDGAAWDDAAELLDEAAVILCRRRGAAIDLVLDRVQNSRSQFVFTQARGRPAVWWQTQKTVRGANPGARVPRGRAAGSFTVTVDTRERYGWRLAGRAVAIVRRALSCGDYAVLVEDRVVAAIERKTLEDLANSLSNGTLAFQMQRLAEIGAAAVVVEGEYADLFRLQPGRGSWLADMLGRLAVRYPDVPVIFAGSRKFAEEWAYRFLGAAAGDADETAADARHLAHRELAPVSRIAFTRSRAHRYVTARANWRVIGPGPSGRCAHHSRRVWLPAVEGRAGRRSPWPRLSADRLSSG